MDDRSEHRHRARRRERARYRDDSVTANISAASGYVGEGSYTSGEFAGEAADDSDYGYAGSKEYGGRMTLEGVLSRRRMRHVIEDRVADVYGDEEVDNPNPRISTAPGVIKMPVNNGLPDSDVRYFEKKLRERMAQLRREIEDTRERREREQYTHVAGEAHDAVDASLAHLTFDTNSAEILRDEIELRDIDEALGRIVAGTYGICLRCGEPIERERLEANPAARRHLICEEAHEREFGKTPTPSL